MLPILAIPGTLCDARLFDPLAAILPGIEATAPIEDASVEAAAARLLETAPPRFLALGFSLGGFVALELLRRAPHRLAGLIMVSSNTEPAQAALVAAKEAELAIVAEHGLSGLIESLWPRYVARRHLSDTALRTLVDEMARSVGIERLARQSALACSRPDSNELVAASPVRVLAVAGAEDRLCPPERAACAGPAGHNHVVDDAGHFLPLEAPQVLASHIAAWRQE